MGLSMIGAAAAVVGLGGGALLGVTVLAPSADPGPAALPAGVSAVEAADVSGAAYRCPGEASDRMLSPGDRVFVIGMDETGEWRAMRDPQALSETLWLPASSLREDEAVSLPIVACDDDSIAVDVETDAAPESTTTVGPSTTLVDVTSTTVPETTTSSEVPESTTTISETTAPPASTTAPPPAATTTTTAPGNNTTSTTTSSTTTSTTTTTTTTSTTSTTTTTTTIAPDTSPPSIGQESAAPSSIFTTSAGVSGCGEASTIEVSATDDRGIASVSGAYGGGLPGSPLSFSSIGGGRYRASFGPFASPPTSPQVSITITARDAAGNSSSTSVTVTVNGCPF